MKTPAEVLTIGDWAYADEARYLQRRIAALRKYGEPVEELEALEKLLAAYVRANTIPDGQRARTTFDLRASLGLGYAISILIERWSSRSDYFFPSRGR